MVMTALLYNWNCWHKKEKKLINKPGKHKTKPQKTLEAGIVTIQKKIKHHIKNKSRNSRKSHILQWAS